MNFRTRDAEKHPVFSLTVLYILIFVFFVILSLCTRKLCVMITKFLEGFELGFLVGRFIT